jgi:type I restriction enzyme R subunit
LEAAYEKRSQLSVQSDGLVRANELLAEWLRGEKSMPFGERGEHTPVRLIDFETGSTWIRVHKAILLI